MKNHLARRTTGTMASMTRKISELVTYVTERMQPLQGEETPGNILELVIMALDQECVNVDRLKVLVEKICPNFDRVLYLTYTLQNGVGLHNRRDWMDREQVRMKTFAELVLYVYKRKLEDVELERFGEIAICRDSGSCDSVRLFGRDVDDESAKERRLEETAAKYGLDLSTQFGRRAAEQLLPADSMSAEVAEE